MRFSKYKVMKNSLLIIFGLSLIAGFVFLIINHLADERNFFQKNSAEHASATHIGLTHSEQQIFFPESIKKGQRSKFEIEVITDLTIAVAGDMMFHGPQLRSAYDANTGTYDFTSVFAHVEPILSAA